MFSTPKFDQFLILLALLLAGCAPGSATMIASYPQNSRPRPAPTALNDSTRLSLQVNDVPSAADQAIDLTQRYSGWVIDRSCRGAGMDQIIELVLAVPPPTTSACAGRCLAWGRSSTRPSGTAPAAVQPVRTRVISTWSSTRPLRRGTLSRLPPAREVVTRPRPSNRAWQVTAAIFTFLLNILIWIVVVGGPFVLIGLGILALVRRARHKPLSENKEIHPIFRIDTKPFVSRLSAGYQDPSGG